MNYPKRMLVENVAWTEEVSARDPDYFSRLAEGQQPNVLWIGCADSRVPAEAITQSQPGELFVHRNIANLVVADDANTASVLEYSVRVLGVGHIVVCGHHKCGGIDAALKPPAPEIPNVNRRIAGLRELAARHRDELDAISDADARVDRLAELNVIEQVNVLRALPLVREAPQQPQVHGWIFAIRNGRLRSVMPENGATVAPAPAAATL